ncbi:aminotransferase class I/II-fold pyridoxal phosphate-dependent enzyme [Priestia filamentosa]|uniref:aminotransferase class I/II-fold pyridoxal phosphate-dependent enzyme n=1 Tax=Priestia filamentosa TaxID=1402861 RepID=UPI00397A1A20
MTPQSNTPLYSKLVDHMRTEPSSYHVPGHKNGEVFPLLGKSLFQDLLKIDATEITGLDDLHAPEGVIKEAQDLAKELYRVEQTFFLVNGSTAGNLASIMSVCQDGEQILVQRDSHKSILNALKLTGAHPLFLTPEIDSQTGFSLGVTENDIKDAIENYPNVKAIVLTNPSYYGVSSNLCSIIKRAHAKRIPVIVDEAHGAHFILDGFPISSVSLGADIVIQSAHKTLPAMTMGSYLHAQGDLIDREEISYFLSILQSSSPSYPIMASLDLARFYLASLLGKEDYILHSLKKFREEIACIDGITVLKPDYVNISQDPLKLSISLVGLSGYELQALLEQRGIYSELANEKSVLLILPLITNFYDEKLIHSLKEIAAQQVSQCQEQEVSSFFLHNFRKSVHPLDVTYQEGKILKRRRINIDEAKGKVTARNIIPYPPGIPLFMEGEKLGEEGLSYLKKLISGNVHIQGIKKPENEIEIFVREDEEV